MSRFSDTLMDHFQSPTNRGVMKCPDFVGNGNLEVENASGTRTTHTWNDENQLTQVAKTGMTTNQYTFNGDGQRVQIVDSQGTKKPIWDFANVLLETDGSNTTQVVYTLEPAGYGNLISQRRGSSSYYLFDALGSTRKLVDFSGTVTDSYDFRAYGETYASSGSTVNVVRWVGELGYYYDVDRLAYYLRARPYSPTLARFLSEDPIGFEGSLWNLYQYASSNPINNLDPSGQKFFDGGDHGFYQEILRRPAAIGPCGGAGAIVQWRLNLRGGRRPVDGWIIQRIKLRYKVRDCNNKIIDDSTICHFEAWQVIGGIIYGGLRDRFGTNIHQSDIFWIPDQGPNTKGTITQSGSVMFVAGYMLKRPPWSFPGDPGHVGQQHVGNLPTLPCAPVPQGWDAFRVIFRSLISSWDCCCQPHLQTNVDLSVGWTRRGDI